MKANNIDARILLMVLVITSSAGLNGCGPGSSTPPAPSSCYSLTDDGAHFIFLKWKEGLAIMFVDRMSNHSASGSGSTDDPVHRHRGMASSADAVGYDWELTTEDGRTADLKINEKTYDLSKGTLFAVQLDGEQVTVHQLDNDLSQLRNRIEDCRKFLQDNPEIVQRVASPATED